MQMLFFLLGRSALVGGAALVVPLVFSLLWHEPGTLFFGLPALFIMAAGVLLNALGRRHKRQLTVREGAFFMVGVWFVFGLIGMLPYALSGELGWVEAFF